MQKDERLEIQPEDRKVGKTKVREVGWKLKIRKKGKWIMGKTRVR